MKYMIANLADGRRLQTIPDVVSGSWAEKLNAADDVSCVVTLNDPATSRLHLPQSAAVGKSILACVDGDSIVAAGPIWGHSYVEDSGEQLTLTGSGMWSYFDHRVLLPVLAGRNPSDPTTNTRFTAISTDPDDPWPTDTRKSLQGIARALVAQAQSWTGGNVPIILPAEITGTNERTYTGADLAFVGQRLLELTQVEGGPDIKFAPRFTSDRLGIEFVMQIGTPDKPLISGLIKPTFSVGVQKSSVSGLQVTVDGSKLASQAFAAGGRTADVVLITESTDSTLPSEGYPLLEAVDSSHSSVSEQATLQGYSDEMVLAGKTPITTLSFDHDVSKSPHLSGFASGDFAEVRVRNNAYLSPGRYQMRITGRSGDAVTKKVSLTFQPVVV